jgi:hypothetical protein
MTTVPCPMGRAHLVQVVANGEAGCRAECLCGWAGPWCDQRGSAEIAAAEHRRAGLGAAAGLDGAVSALLDLQDDLADAVTWLVENWSADLPVPQLTIDARPSGGRHAALTLSARGETPAQRARLAQLLCPGEGAGHAHADRRTARLVRDFGLIRLEVGLGGSGLPCRRRWGSSGRRQRYWGRWGAGGTC